MDRGRSSPPGPPWRAATPITTIIVVAEDRAVIRRVWAALPAKDLDVGLRTATEIARALPMGDVIEVRDAAGNHVTINTEDAQHLLSGSG